MALDTRSKRASALGFGLVALVSFPDPVSGIDQGDRQQALGLYRGILAGAGGIGGTSRLYRMMMHVG